MNNYNITEIAGGVCAPKGFKASGVHCGIRKNKSKRDLALIVSEVTCTAAAVYTQNKVKGAPLTVTAENLKKRQAQAIICNSGNANTCAPNGIDIARRICELTGDALACPKYAVIVASTGVIGQELDISPFESGIPEAARLLSSDGSDMAANAIMTTDTVKKEIAVSFALSGTECHLGAVAKGSGMINPNMATLLCFITTDASISEALLQKALSECVGQTLNQISVDGDTSTNDMAVILANGLARNNTVVKEGEDYAVFKKALLTVLTAMARELAADGEGATKLITCNVKNAPDTISARKVSKSVISSDLLKCMIFGRDANWGRVLCAVGNADAEFDVSTLDVRFSSVAGTVLVCKNAAHHPFSEEDAAKILAEKEIVIEVDMKQGAAEASAWGCDMTYDYVKINGDYRS